MTMTRSNKESLARSVGAEGAPICLAPFDKNKVILEMAFVTIGIDADDASLTVNCAKHLPATGTFITKSGEKVLYGGKTGNVLTPLTRAQGGTTAALINAEELIAVIPEGVTSYYAPSEFSRAGYFTKEGLKFTDKRTYEDIIVERGSMGQSEKSREITLVGTLYQASIEEIALNLGVDVAAQNDMKKLNWASQNNKYVLFAAYKLWNKNNTSTDEVFYAHEAQLLSELEFTNQRNEDRTIPFKAVIWVTTECVTQPDGPYQIYGETIS